MFPRKINISKERSFFLFGARATGKSTLLKQLFPSEEAIFIDLLNPRLYEELLAYPNQLEGHLKVALENKKVVVIDEVQKVPALLDIVHQYIHEYKLKFALTGSSARKLKRGSANMLAGRASIYNLFPLLFTEIGSDFSLQESLEW